MGCNIMEVIPLGIQKGKGYPLANGHRGEAAFTQLTSTNNRVSEVGCHSSFSAPYSPSPVLKRARYPFPAA